MGLAAAFVQVNVTFFPSSGEKQRRKDRAWPARQWEDEEERSRSTVSRGGGGERNGVERVVLVQLQAVSPRPSVLPCIEAAGRPRAAMQYVRQKPILPKCFANVCGPRSDKWGVSEDCAVSVSQA